MGFAQRNPRYKCLLLAVMRRDSPVLWRYRFQLQMPPDLHGQT